MKPENRANLEWEVAERLTHVKQDSHHEIDMASVLAILGDYNIRRSRHGGLT
jgi:hypothetical protein